MATDKFKSEEQIKELQKNANLFEQFWLRPEKFKNRSIKLRLRINRKWDGWKLRDDLIEALGLKVGETISTDVTVYYISDFINDDNNTKLYVCGDCVDWLLTNRISEGSVIDCIVRFSYEKMPIDLNKNSIFILSLILEEIIESVGNDEAYLSQPDDSDIESLINFVNRHSES